MKINLLTFFVVITMTITACAQQTETRDIGPFDKLQAGGSFDVVLEKGSSPSVRIETASIDPKEILTEVDKGSLKIYTKKDKYKNIRTTVYVTFTALKAIERSGSGNLTCNSDVEDSDLAIKSSGSGNFTQKKSFIAKELVLNGSGSGNIKISEIDSRSLALSLSGSGNIEIEEGSAQSADITLSGSGNIEAFGLKTKKAEIKINGSGNVDVSVDDSLTGKISGSGNITYKGKLEKYNVKIAGSGEVHRR